MTEREIYSREFGSEVADHILKVCEAARGITAAVADARRKVCQGAHERVFGSSETQAQNDV